MGCPGTRKGAECRFSHDKEPQTAEIVCRFLLRGDCERGAECKYSHDLKRVPCKFHHVAKRCKLGEACPFGHGALTDEQREWVEREWEVNSKERKEALARAMRTEQEAQARVAAGEEVHTELSRREMGGDEELFQGPWDEADEWLAIPLNPPAYATIPGSIEHPANGTVPSGLVGPKSDELAAKEEQRNEEAGGKGVLETREIPLWLQ